MSRRRLLPPSSSPGQRVEARTDQAAEALARLTQRVTADTGQVCAALVRPRGRRRRTLITRIDGSVVAELVDAAHGDITLGFVADGPNRAAVTMPARTASAAAEAADNLQELTLLRGDQVLLRGPITRPQRGLDSTSCTVSGAEWYLTRRVVGRVPRNNYIANPDFSQGMRHWSLGADAQWKADNPYAGETVSIVGYPTATGTRAAKLTVPAGTPKPQVRLVQRVTFTVPDDVTEGEEWSAVAYCYIPAGEYIGPAQDDRLLTITLGSTTEPSPYPDVLALAPGTKKTLDISTATISDLTPRNQWVRLEATLHQPLRAGQACTVQVQLAAIEGTIYWDHATLHRSEKLRFRGVDQRDIIAGLVEHAQDPDYGKSAVSLAVTGPATGKLRDRVYLFDEHAVISDAVGEFAGLDQGVDVQAVYPPSGHRLLRVSSPKARRRLPQVRLVVGGETVAQIGTWDGERAASTDVVLGEGSGSSREEGVATTATGVGPDAVVLENVSIAAPETRIDGLDEQAAANLDASHVGHVLELTTRPASPLAGLVWCGDELVVDTRATNPPSGWYRVVAVTLHPDDSLDLTLNQVA